MKTFKTILVTMMVTAVVMVAGFIGYLVNSGNITVDKREQSHSRVVIEDGEIVDAKDWIETLGYEFNVNIFDGTYIGR